MSSPVSTIETPTHRPRGRSRRSIAALNLVAGVIGLVVAVALVFVGWRLVDRAGDGASVSLGLTADALDTADETIALANETVSVAAGAIAELEAALADADATLDGIGELLDRSAEVVGDDVPASLQAIRDTMPALITSAELIDDALEAIPFVDLGPGSGASPADALGRLDDGLAQIGVKLQSQSEALRELGSDFSRLAGGADSVTSGLAVLVDRMDEANRLLAEYVGTARGATEVVEQASADLARQQRDAKVMVLLVGLAVVLGQVVPLTLAWSRMRGDLVDSRSDGPVSVREVEV